MITISLKEEIETSYKLIDSLLNLYSNIDNDKTLVLVDINEFKKLFEVSYRLNRILDILNKNSYNWCFAPLKKDINDAT